VKVITKISVLQKEAKRLKRKGLCIGFVPTMGALHEGHLSLVRAARKDNDRVVVSIFVNPLQFGPHEDFKKYPRDLKKDSKLLQGLCDVLFVPSSCELYQKDFCSTLEVKGLSDRLCARSRPGHFVGVTTVVAKLFNAVLPDYTYFGQKDAQQAIIIQKMVRDFNFPVKIKVLPIVREKDGLAMSSRNACLSVKERSDAVVLFQALKSAEHLVASGTRDTAKIKKTLVDFISRTPTTRIDYIEIVDRANLAALRTIEKDALLFLAVYLGKTRLIDNTLLKVSNQ
jgi:pantoate--beta-alanine ligase